MTREEQIDWLCRLRASLNNGIIITPWNKKFTEALTDILEQELNLDEIRAEIAEYKDDKIIHAEQNEMIDIVLEIIDKHIEGGE